jgi:hypothetical protein
MKGCRGKNKNTRKGQSQRLFHTNFKNFATLVQGEKMREM